MPKTKEIIELSEKELNNIINGEEIIKKNIMIRRKPVFEERR